MSYGKAIVIFIVGLIIVFLLQLVIGGDAALLGMLVLAIVMIYSIISAAILGSGAVQPRNSGAKRILKDRMSEEFKNLYKYIIENYAQELEKLRKKLILIITITVIFSIVAITIFGYIQECFITSESDNFFINGGFIFIPVFLYLYYQYDKHHQKYQERYKEVVVKNFIETLYNNLNYQNEVNNELERYYGDAQFDGRRYLKFISNDYISGRVNGTWIEMSDVILQTETRRSEHMITIHNCVFSCSKINKNILGEIRIKNNKNINILKNNKIELDNPEFEKCFDVFGDSRILAMEILTHDIMEEMIEFYNNIGLDFEIVIKENRIYVKYDVGDIFEGEILRKSTNMETLWIFYNIIQFAINLTQKMNRILEEKIILI